MAKVILLPEKHSIEVSEKKFLKNELEAKGITIRSSCGGHGTCAECVVKIVKGMDQCSPPTYQEIKLLGNIFHLTNERLSCQVKVLGQVELDLNKQLALQIEKKNSISKSKLKPKPLRRKPPEKIQEPVVEEPPKVSLENDRNLKKHERAAQGKQGGFNRPKRKS